MDKLKSQIDLFLTEISIELLGNKIYDINGKRQDKLINLFKALPENHRGNEKDFENTNDFLCSISYQSDYSDNDTSIKEFLDDQLDFILKDANKSEQDNAGVIDFIRDYKSDQNRLLSDISELNLKRIVERQNKIITSLASARSKVSNQHQKSSDQEKTLAILKYYADEKNELLKMSMDTLRLMKYILNDPRNEAFKAEFIGYIHAMRQVKDDKTKAFPGSKTKPYRLSKDRQKDPKPSSSEEKN